MSLFPAEKLSLCRQLTASNSAVMPGVRRGHQVPRPATPAFRRSFLGVKLHRWRRPQTKNNGEYPHSNVLCCLIQAQRS